MPIQPKQLTIGTMRFDPERYDEQHYAQLLVEAHRLGVEMLHISDEYDSWQFFLDILATVRRHSKDVRFRFIAKLGEPHFDQPVFNAERLEEHLARYRNALNTECVDDVQWMWRAKLVEDDHRCAAFVSQADVIGDKVRQLRRRGIIKRFLCFPYSPQFATLALQYDFIDGLVVYRNSQERQYDGHLIELHKRSKMAHVIRPFFGGATLAVEALPPRRQLDIALDHHVIETAIVSTGTINHLHDLLG
jgi:hypothetical protein